MTSEMMTGGGAQIQTLPEIAEAHATSIKSLKLITTISKADISFTTIGDVLTGLQENSDTYKYAKIVETDVKNYATNIVGMSDEKQEQDQESAQAMRR